MASVTPSATVDGIDPGLMIGAVAQASRPKAEEPDSVNGIDAQTRISSDGMLQSALAAVVDVGGRMAQPSSWLNKTASSSRPDIVRATSTADAKPVKLSVQVRQLATPQVTSAAMFTPFATTVGIGNLNLTMGEWNAAMSSFTPNPNWPKASITAGPGDVSIERLRDRINAAGLGVTANVISDATGTFLLLRSASSGRANGFQVTVDTTSAASAEQATALQSLGFNPAMTSQGMTLQQPAQDAEIDIDGQELRQTSSNLVMNAAQGVDLSLKRATATPVEIKVEIDRSGLKSMTREFISTVNELQQLSGAINQDSGLSKATKATLSNIDQIWQKGSLSSLKSAFDRMGIGRNQSGTLQLDERKLDDVLSNWEDQRIDLSGLSDLLSPATSILPSLDRLSSADRSSSPTSGSTSPMVKQRQIEQYTDGSIHETDT